MFRYILKCSYISLYSDDDLQFPTVFGTWSSRFPRIGNTFSYMPLRHIDRSKAHSIYIYRYIYIYIYIIYIFVWTSSDKCCLCPSEIGRLRNPYQHALLIHLTMLPIHLLGPRAWALLGPFWGIHSKKLSVLLILHWNISFLIILYRRLAVWDICYFHVAFSRYEFG